MNPRKAIAAIHHAGAVLVFPMENRKEPLSLWRVFYPRSVMRWEWDDSGDDRVARLWQLRGDLSTSNQVVYTKWFRGRATYLSPSLFRSLLRVLNPQLNRINIELSATAKQILGLLEDNSPLSTKTIKRLCDLKGRDNEALYQRALKELWSRLLIVAYGEVDDGAFPSLAVGASKTLFEDHWKHAFELDVSEAQLDIKETLGESSLFYQYFLKLQKAQAVVQNQRTSKRKRSAKIRYADLH